MVNKLQNETSCKSKYQNEKVETKKEIYPA